MHGRIEFYRHDLGEEEIESVRETLSTLFLTLGPRVAEFEEEFARFLGVEYVVGTSSCTMGLVLTMRAHGIGPGDEVITTPMTFVATANAVLMLGATPVFVDVDPCTGLIDPAGVEAAVTSRTRAIIAVHLYGQLADMRRLRQIADRHALVLIEDAAHAVESEREGVQIGQLGDAAAFSFYTTKAMTCGDGGAIAVHDEALATRLRRLRNHGVSKDAAARHGGAYQHWDLVELGFKCSLTDIAAALLLPQIARLPRRRSQREAIVERYERALDGAVDIQLVKRLGRSGHHLFTILVPIGTRDAVLGGLGRRGIGVAVNYRALHTLEYYRGRFGYKRDAYPNAADIGDRTVSLPLWPGMADADVDRVVQALNETLRELSRRK